METQYFNVELALKHGLNGAILLDYIYSKGNYISYVTQSVDYMKTKLIFLTTKEITGALNRLIKANVMEKTKFVIAGSNINTYQIIDPETLALLKGDNNAI